MAHCSTGTPWSGGVHAAAVQLHFRVHRFPKLSGEKERGGDELLPQGLFQATRGFVDGFRGAQAAVCVQHWTPFVGRFCFCGELVKARKKIIICNPPSTPSPLLSTMHNVMHTHTHNSAHSAHTHAARITHSLVRSISIKKNTN